MADFRVCDITCTGSILVYGRQRLYFIVGGLFNIVMLLPAFRSIAIPARAAIIATFIVKFNSLLLAIYVYVFNRDVN